MLKKLITENDLKKFGEYKLELIKFHKEYANKLGLVDKVIDGYTYEDALKHIGEQGYFQFLINYKNNDVGMLEYEIQNSKIDNNKIIYISCIYIKEEYRGLGIGRIIIYELKKQNIRIELECWYGMPANNLYRSLGMKEITTRYILD